MSNAAIERRLTAIQDLVGTFLDENQNMSSLATVESINTEIQKLVPLGKTLRWSIALSRWQDMVRDSRSDLRWALLQGSVFAGYAAL